jgi:thiamine-phosphate diphosphorylase
MWPRPVICFVTDRRRLAARLERDPDSPQILEDLASRVQTAAEAGIDLVQVRENDLPTRAMTDWIRRLVAIVRGTRTRIVVNDRLDVALAAGAHGVHLKDAPIALERIRAVVPGGFLVGQSIHSPERAGESTADYLVFGSLFATRSKPGTRPVGLGALESAVRRARAPVLGIGGVNRAYLSAIAATGAAGIAAVDLFLPSGSDAREPLHEIATAVRETF